MRVVAIIIGILGSMALFAGGIFALLAAGLAGGLGTMTGDTDAVNTGKEVASLGVAAILVSIMALVGACLSIAKPKVAAVMMLLSAIGGVIAISMFGVLGGILLLVGTLFAFLGRNEKRSQS